MIELLLAFKKLEREVASLQHDLDIANEVAAIERAQRVTAEGEVAQLQQELETANEFGRHQNRMAAEALLLKRDYAARAEAAEGEVARLQQAERAAFMAEEFDKLQWVVDNIYTIARRESLRKELRPEMWQHVLRLCESAGAKSRTVGVLRAETANNE